jgi:hypothetical protein
MAVMPPLSPVIERQHDQERETDGGGQGQRDEAVEKNKIGALGRLYV